MLTVGNTVPSAPIFISLSTTLLNWAVSEMLWSVAVVLIWYKLQLGRKKNWIALERFLGTAGRVHLVLPHLNFPEYTEEVCLSSYVFHHMTPFPLPSAILTFCSAYSPFIILFSSRGHWNILFLLVGMLFLPSSFHQLLLFEFHCCFLRKSHQALCLD